MSYRSLKDGDLANPLSLDEFFDGLGGLMRLPPKPGEDPSQPPRPRRRTRFLLPTVAIVFAVLLTALETRLKQGSDQLPAGLTGRWATIATDYSDRVLEFLPDRVVFHSGPAQADRAEHLITMVRSRQVGDTTLITLSYLEAGSSYDLALKYTTIPEPGVRFTNQDHLVWRPAPTASR